MKWVDIFTFDQMPSMDDIRHYLGETASAWDELTSYIENEYQVKPQMSYSKCCAQPGWNVKYKKSSKSLCTLYPMEGYFITLVVVGAKEEVETELLLDTKMLTSYVTELYRKTPFSAGGHWLMIEVHENEKAVLNDIKAIIAIRVSPKRKHRSIGEKSHLEKNNSVQLKNEKN